MGWWDGEESEEDIFMNYIEYDPFVDGEDDPDVYKDFKEIQQPTPMHGFAAVFMVLLFLFLLAYMCSMSYVGN